MAAPSASIPPTSQPRRSAGGIVIGAVLLVLGVLIGLVGGGMLAGGIAVTSVSAMRDADGFLMTPAGSFTADSYAITSPPTEPLEMGAGVENVPFDLATLRLSATSDQDVFIGIASRADIDEYLADVAHREIRRIHYGPFEVRYRDIAGTTSPAPPGTLDIWVASASGPGTQQIDWSIAPGDWGIVVLNADGGEGIDVQLQAGVRSDLFAPFGIGMLVGGGLLLLVAIPLIVGGAVMLSVGGRSTGRPGAPGGGHAPTPGTAATASGPPVQLRGVLDENLSRGLWLVKWLLAFPHYVILAFLWVAFAVTTVIAWFAIVFTARYPRSLFDFNVGVLRWSWRVAFYSYAALGTDRYPPFTLGPADYPAELHIAYPERLSRGLVWVKSWLLAIPHYLILGAISGAVTVYYSATFPEGIRTTGMSLAGILVLIAGLALLFTARYPRGLFDLLLGISRWGIRVVAYAALLRDDYPPFRLDQGPLEPGAAP